MQYSHVECAFASFRRARITTNTIRKWNELDGFDDLNDTDKSHLNKLIEKENTTRKILQLPQTHHAKKSTQLQTPHKARQTRLVSTHLPVLNVMFTNADQLTSSKRSELIKRVGQEKPLVIAICEIKPKNSKERTTTDYEIPGFSLHPTNLGPDSNTGRGIAVYTHCSIDQSVLQIQPRSSYDEVCLLEIRLRGGGGGGGGYFAVWLFL